jgi:hypothetical protein
MRTEGMSEEARRFWDFVERLRVFAVIVSVYVIGLIPLLIVAVLIEGGDALTERGYGPGEVRASRRALRMRAVHLP